MRPKDRKDKVGYEESDGKAKPDKRKANKTNRNKEKQRLKDYYRK